MAPHRAANTGTLPREGREDTEPLGSGAPSSGPIWDQFPGVGAARAQGATGSPPREITPDAGLGVERGRSTGPRRAPPRGRVVAPSDTGRPLAGGTGATLVPALGEGKPFTSMVIPS